MFQVQHVVYTPQQNGPHEIHPEMHGTIVGKILAIFRAMGGIHCSTVSTSLSFLNNYMTVLWESVGLLAYFIKIHFWSSSPRGESLLLIDHSCLR